MESSPIPKIDDDIILSLLHPAVFEIIGRRARTEHKLNRSELHYNNGCIFIDRDENTVSINAFTGEKEIVHFKVRDRRFDGPQDYRSPLQAWPYNSEHDIVKHSTVELSTYSRDPGKYINDMELLPFLHEPFDFIFDDPNTFVRLWNRAFHTGYYPGQHALPLKDAAWFFVEKSKRRFNNLGYETALSPSHYNVVHSALRWGYMFQSSWQRAEFNELERVLSDFSLDETISSQQKSWIVILQKFPSLLKSDISRYWLHGLELPLYYDGNKVENIWMVQSESMRRFNDYRPENCFRRLINYGRKKLEARA